MQSKARNAAHDFGSGTPWQCWTVLVDVAVVVGVVVGVVAGVVVGVDVMLVVVGTKPNSAQTRAARSVTFGPSSATCSRRNAELSPTFTCIHAAPTGDGTAGNPKAAATVENGTCGNGGSSFTLMKASIWVLDVEAS